MSCAANGFRQWGQDTSRDLVLAAGSRFDGHCPTVPDASTLGGVRRVALLCSLGLVSVAAAFAASAPAGGGCEPTLNDGAGPFSRGAPPLRAKIGTGHVLTGIVLSTDCKPLAGARVQLMQSNRNYVYTRALSGTVITNRAGRFRYEGPRPTSSSGRPAHIHLRVIADEHEILYARYVPAPGARRGTIRLVLEPSAL